MPKSLKAGEGLGDPVETVTDVIRHDRVAASAERVMRKHRATFAALAK